MIEVTDIVEETVRNFNTGLCGQPYHNEIVFKHQSKLIASERLALFDLLKRNMKMMYERSGDGWKDGFKRKEMFSVNSMFLMLFSQENCKTIQAFLHFQIVDEDTLEPGVTQKVVYWQV